DHSCCGGSPAVAPPAAPGTKYTCPMHPEIVRDGPGTCPLCGMALEPMIPTAGPADDTELRDMIRRLWLAGGLTLPGFVLAMGPMITGVSWPDATVSAANWIGLLFSTPVVFYAGWPFFVRAADGARHRTANMFTLIVLGVIAAWGYSTAATLAPGLFP